MQKSIKKRGLSFLLVFVMLFSMIVGNASMVYAVEATDNPTVNAALDVLNPPANTPALNLKGHNIVGAVNIDQLLAHYPGLVQVVLEETNTTSVINNTGVIVRAEKTFVDNTRKLTESGRLSFDRTDAQDITASDILAALNIDTAGDAIDPEDLLDVIDVRFGSYHTGAVSIDAGYAGVAIPKEAFDTVPAGTYSVDLDVWFMHDYTGSYGTLSLPVDVLDNSLSMTADPMYSDPYGDYVYEEEEITFVVERRSAQPEILRPLLSADDFSITLVETGGPTPLYPVTPSPRVNVDVVDDQLLIKVKATLVTPGTIENWIIQVQDLMDSSVNSRKQMAFEVRPRESYATFGLRETNGGVIDGSDFVTATALPLVDGTSTMFVNRSTSVSSHDMLKVGNGPYGSTTKYILMVDGAPLGKEELPSITINNNTTNQAVTAVKTTALDSSDNEVAAIEFSADFSAPTNVSVGDVEIIISTAGGVDMKITLDCMVLVGDVKGYEIYQLPGDFDTTMPVVDLEQILNGGPSVIEDYEIKLLAEAPVQSDGSFQQTNFWPAEVAEDYNLYLLPVVITGSNDKRSILAEESVQEWYDDKFSGSPRHKFDIGTTTAFSSEPEFIGKATNAYWKSNVLEVETPKVYGDAAEKDVRVGFGIFDGFATTDMYAVIEVIPEESLGYFFAPAGFTGDRLTSQDTITSDEIPIGIAKNYRIVKKFNNNKVKLMDYTELAVSMDFADTSIDPYFFEWRSDAPAGEIVVSATERGGENDELVGKEATITVKDASGEEGTLDVSLYNTVVKSLAYYIDAPKIPTLEVDETGVITTDTASVGIVDKTANNSTDLLTLPKGMTADVYIVPTFSNLDIQDKVDTDDDWRLYTAHPGDFAYKADNQMSTNQNPIWGPYAKDSLLATADSLDASNRADYDADHFIIEHVTNSMDNILSNVDDEIYLEFKSNSGSIRLTKDAVASGTTAVPGYETYFNGKIGEPIGVTSYFKAGKHIVSAMDAEEYEHEELNSFGYVSLADKPAPDTNTIEKAAAGEAVQLRTKIAFNDSEYIDGVTLRGTPPYAFGADHPLLQATSGFRLEAPVPVPSSATVTTPFDTTSSGIYEYRALYRRAEEGLFFMQNSLLPDTHTAYDLARGNGYDAATGPVILGQIRHFEFDIVDDSVGPAPKSMSSLSFTDPAAVDSLDVLRAHYASTYANDFSWHMENGSALTDINFGRSGLQLHAELQEIMDDIKFMILDGYGNDVTDDVTAGWSAEYPGIFEIIPGSLGSYRILFYEEYTLDNGEEVKTAIAELEPVGLEDVYVVNIGEVTTGSSGMILVGSNVTYETGPDRVNSDGTDGEYVHDQGVPGSFTVYPVIVDARYRGDAASLVGLTFDDVLSKEGLEFMYTNDFPIPASGFGYTPNTTDYLWMDIDSPVASSGQYLWETQDLDGNDIITLRVNINSAFEDTEGKITVGYNDLDVIYNSSTPIVLYTGTGGPVDGGSDTTTPFYYEVLELNQVRGISMGNAFEVLSTTETIPAVNGKASMPIPAGEAFTIDVIYQTDRGERNLVSDELLYVNLTGSAALPTNALRLTPDSKNPGTCVITGRSGSTSSYLTFTASQPGVYKFALSTTNSGGTTVPSAAGARIIEFEIKENVQEDTQIVYGQMKEIIWSDGGSTPTYTVTSNTNNILDEDMVAYGYLKMAKNEDGTARIDVTRNGVNIGSFEVDMLAVKGDIVPKQPDKVYDMEDGSFARLREKIVLDSGDYIYNNVINVEPSDVMDLNASGNPFLKYNETTGLVEVDGTGFSDGALNMMNVTTEDGAYHPYEFTGKYRAPKTPATQYPTDYTVSDAVVVIPVGGTQRVVVSTSVVGFNNDEHLYLVPTGDADVVGITYLSNSPGWISLSGQKPGRAVIDVENNRGVKSNEIEVYVVEPLKVSVTPEIVWTDSADTTNFVAEASGGYLPGSAQYKYQWQVSENGGIWTDIASATTDTLTVTSAAGMDGNQYRCIVEDQSIPAVTTAISNAATLRVDAGTGIDTFDIGGNVEAAGSGSPIEDAIVLLVDSSGDLIDQTTTDVNGDYVFNNVLTGMHTVYVSANGYFPDEQPVNITTFDQLSVNFSLTADPSYSGGHTVFGIVTDDGGNLVDGVVVNLLDSSSNVINFGTTNTNGIYRIFDVANGSYDMATSKAGYTDETGNVTVADDDEQVDFTITLSSGSTTQVIDGYVYDSSNSNAPIANAQLDLDDGINAAIQTTTDPTGYYSITVPAAIYDVTASKFGYTSQTINVDASTTDATQDFYLSEELKISGHVTDGSSPIYPGSVELDDGITTRTAPTDPTGYYEFVVVPGTYDLEATAPLYDPQTVSGVVITNSSETVDFTLSLSPAIYRIDGTVLEEGTGNVIPGGVTVEVRDADGVSDSDTTDGTGAFVVGPLSNGDYTVFAYADGYYPLSVPVTINGGDKTLALELKVNDDYTGAGYMVYGQVTDSVDGSFIAGADVTLFDVTAQDEFDATVTDDQGMYWFMDVPDEDYELDVEAEDYVSELGITVTVAGDKKEVNVELDPIPTYMISGLVTDDKNNPLKDATVTLNGGSGQPTSASGYYEFKDLVAGDYTIKASLTGYTAKSINVTVANSNVTAPTIALSSGGGGGTGGGGGGGGNPTRTAEITLSPATIYIGDESTATVSKLLSDNSEVALASNARFTWSLGNDTIASIASEDGKTITLEGLAVGTTTVKVSVVNSNVTYTGSVTLTVREEEEFVPGGGFTDVPSTFWGYDAVTYLADKGFVNGYDDGTFRPNNAILRNEFAVMLANSMEWGTATSAQLQTAAAHFADWSEIPSWAQNAWALSLANNTMAGNLNDGAYYAEGGRNISRQEVSVVFSKLLGTNATAPLNFSDAAEIASWAAAAVQECVAEGLISGYEDNTFRPTANITRAESATIFYKYLTMEKSTQQPEETTDGDAVDGQTEDNQSADEQ